VVPSFSPLSLGPSLWLRGDLGISLNGSTVSAWADQSGNGNNATQPTAIQQPAQSTTINSQACVSFNGSTAMRLPNFIAAGAKTVVLVRKINSTPAGLTATVNLINAAATLESCFFLKNAGASPNRAWCADMTGGTTMNGAAETVDLLAHMDLADWNGAAPNTTAANNDMYLDGTAQSIVSGFFVTPVLTDFSSIGARIDSTGTLTLGSNVDIAEVIVYSNQLAASDRNKLGGYVQTRYGITVAGATF
jgi:hypothetical protein